MPINKQLLIERLLQRIDLDRIFLFSYSFLGKEQQHLILVMKPEDGVSSKVMKPVVELCLIDAPEVSFELILFGEWRNKIRQGSLYYAYASLPKHEIYTSPRKKTKSLSVSEIGGVVELSQQWSLKMSTTGIEFREGATKFAENGDYLKATFMVHQSLESFLRLPQMMIQGKVNNIHHLENRMRSLSSHFPGFRTVLLSDSFIDTETFRLLDKCFQAVKQNKDLEVSAFDASYLYDKCCEISKAIEILYQFFLNALKAEQQHRLEQAEEEKAVKKVAVRSGNATNQVFCEDFSDFPWSQQYKNDVNMLLDKVRSNYNPEQVVMLNYHTGGFSGNNLFQQRTDATNENGIKVELYLVVLMKNMGPFRFKCLQVGVASAMIVYLDLGYVERKLAEGDRFVHTMWTKGHVLRKKSTFEPNFVVKEVDLKGEYEELEKIWKRGKVVIDNLVSTANGAHPLFVDTGVLLLRNILEVGVYSFLRVAAGFVPKTKNLDELLDWTGMIDRQLLDYLFEKSGIRGQVMHFVLHPKRVWWDDVLLDSIEEVTPDFYRLQAEKLVKLFDKICSRAIERIKKEAITTSSVL